MEEESPAADGSEELYERLTLKVDKGQEPLRIDKFLVQRKRRMPRAKSRKLWKPGWCWSTISRFRPIARSRPLDEIVLYSDKEAHGEEIVPEPLPLQHPL